MSLKHRIPALIQYLFVCKDYINYLGIKEIDFSGSEIIGQLTDKQFHG